MNDEIIGRAIKIIKEHPTAILATLDNEGYPQLRQMHTMDVDDNLTIYFATGRNMLKCKQISENPKVSALWNAYMEDAACWSHVLIKGNAEVRDDAQIKERLWTDELEQYFPEGPKDPAYVVIVISPRHLVYMDGQTYPPKCIEL